MASHCLHISSMILHDSEWGFVPLQDLTHSLDEDELPLVALLQQLLNQLDWSRIDIEINVVMQLESPSAL